MNAKSLILKIIVLAGLAFAISGLVKKTLPFGWGDDVLYLKYNHFQENKNNYNTLFLGGSLMYRHINCHLLDSITNANELETQSFNMGIDGLHMPKQLWVLDKILEDDPENLDYLFVTLASTSKFLYLNMHTRKFVTWNDLSTIKYSIGILKDLPYSLKEKVRLIYLYTISILENKVHAGLGEDIIEFQTKRRHQQDLAYLGKNKDGYFPYEHEETHLIKHQDWDKDMLFVSKEHINQMKKRNELVNQATEQFQNFALKEKYSKSILNAYMSAIKKAEKKGVKLIVVLPPRTRENYDIFLQVHERLPENNKLNLASPIEYPEFYTFENSYNFHHFNMKGASLYTQEFARKFLELEKN